MLELPKRYRGQVMGTLSSASDIGWPGLIERPRRGKGTWPDERTAVLIHGAMDRGAGMAHIARRLSDAPTIRYDRRGYGRAASLHAGDLVVQVDDLIGIIADRPVVLFGHSLGGLVALATAADGRGDVRGVVTWETPTPWIETWPSWGVADPGPVGDPAGAIAESFMRSAIGGARFEALPQGAKRARRSEGAALIADLDQRFVAGPPFDPNRIDVPCLFGAGDRVLPPYASGATWLATHIDRAGSRVIPGVGHDAPMTHPDEIVGLIREIAAATAIARTATSEETFDAITG